MFLAEILNNVYKRVFRVCFILFRSRVINKKIKNLVSVGVCKPGFFQFLQITQDLNKIKKNSQIAFCKHRRVGNVCNILAKSIRIIVGARQSFQFFRQNIWFLQSNKALSVYLSGRFYY